MRRTIDILICSALLISSATSSPSIGAVVDPVLEGEVHSNAPDQSQAKGHDTAARVFAIGGAEVNAFNFNLMVGFSEGIGFSLPVDGGLQLSLARHYNSNIVNEMSWQCEYECEMPPPRPSGRSIKYYSVERQYPLGLGWEFHLGRIYEKPKVIDGSINCNDRGNPSAKVKSGLYAYLAPDGSEHQLVFAPLESTGDTQVYYSKDGSMLKATFANGSWVLYSPDGTVTEFGHAVTGTVFEETDQSTIECEDGEWPLFKTGIPGRPPYGNYVERNKRGWYVNRIRGREEVGGQAAAWIRVEYQDPPFHYIVRRVYDSHDDAGHTRSIDVVIERSDANLPAWGHVVEVHVPAPPDDGGPRPKSVFQFSYERMNLSIAGHQHPVEVLTGVTSPLGYGVRYTYWPAEVAGACSDPDGCTDTGGQLKSISYPSGKLVRFRYGEYEREWRRSQMYGEVDPTHGGDTCECLKRPRLDDEFTGIVEKEEFLDGDETNTSPGNYRTWTFDSVNREKPPIEFQIGPSEQDGRCWINADSFCRITAWYSDSVVRMTDPAGNVHEIVFDTSTSGVEPWTDYRSEPQSGAVFGRPIEDTQFAGNQPVSEAAVRRTFSRWTSRHSDPLHGIKWASLNWENVRYVDDDDTLVTTTHEDWNADAGAYETTVVSGNGVGNERRVDRTDFAIGNAECAYAATLKANWLPGVVAARSSARTNRWGLDEQVIARTDFEFDTATGRVTDAIARAAPASETICSPTAAPEDIVTHFDYDAAGNVEHRGVRFGSAPSEQFGTDYEWEYGVEKRARNTALGYDDVLRTIDSRTSLVLREETGVQYSGDPVGVIHETAYDELHRAIRERTGTLEPTNVEYLNESMGDGRVRLRATRTWRGSGDHLVESVEHYDHAGRVVKKEKLNPDGSRAYQHTRFNASGLVTFVSDWTTSAADHTGLTGTTTSYTDTVTGIEDPFGRPRRITGSLGEVTTFDYFGTNRRVTVEGVAGGNQSVTPIDTISTYYTDGLGRLRVVDTDKRVAGGAVTDAEGADAIYGYDVSGRLLSVNVVDQVVFGGSAGDRYATSNPTSPDQQRSFSYDALGRQVQATHPESGTTTTLKWNALGSPTEVQDALGAARGHKHETTYAPDGRPELVERVVPTSEAFKRVLPPDDPGWTEGWPTANSVACLDRIARYIGNSDCRYALSVGAPLALISPTIESVPPGATLSFEYFRDTRSSPPDSEDSFRVFVTLADPEDWKEVFRLDATQIAWNRWQRSPAIPLDGIGSGRRNIKIKFVFTAIEANVGTNKGIGIGDVVVQHPERVKLAETTYDQGFGIASNKYRGKPTTIKVWDEGWPTQAAAFTRKFEYVQNEGLLSRETFTTDWDRDGSTESFEAFYEYDPFGRLSRRQFPHITGASARWYDYEYTRGALTGLTSGDSFGTQAIVIPGAGNPAPGIEYDINGGMKVVRFGNRVQAVTDYNVAGLPWRFRVDDASGNLLFDTGTYEYDGARNIKQIGSDLYRYDAAQRLDWARVTSSQSQGNLDLDQSYDPYGNMLAQTTTQAGGSTPTPLGPAGLHFTGRTHAGNRIANAGFQYDANGNLTDEPAHDGVGGYRYRFTPENRVAMINPIGNDGTPLLTAQYDPSGHRWMRTVWSDGGKGLITLRDATGKVTAEYVASSADSGLVRAKEYIHANGQLVAINSACGPRPSLTVSNPALTGGQVWFDRVDHITSKDGFRIFIETESGQTKVLTRGSNLPLHFSIAENEFFPNENNWISIETDAECGQTGYSNAVSHVYNPGGPCARGVTIFQTGGYQNLTSNTTIAGLSTCAAGTLYNYYFEREGSGGAVRLNTQPHPLLRFVLANQPTGTGYGRYWFAPVNPVTLVEGTASPAAILDGRNAPKTNATNGGTGPQPVPVNTQYVHWDHLGSTRMMTDEKGAVIARYKYYPFGHEAEVTSGDDNRMMFTGHERDKGLGLDYMLARYYAALQARFLSVDPALESADPINPQTWNRYSYAENNPVHMFDPDGEAPHVAIGALVGAAWGGGAELIRQVRSGGDLNIAKIGTGAAKGMAVGAVAAATGGASLWVAGAAVGGTTVVAGMGERALDMDASTEALDAGDITTDAIGGVVGGAVGAKVGQTVTDKVASSQTQKVAARMADSRLRAAARRSPSRQAARKAIVEKVAAAPADRGRKAGGAARAATATATRSAAEEVRRTDEQK